MSDIEHSMENKSCTVAALITAVKAGDKDSFSDIITVYEPLIRSIVNKFSVELSDGDDIRQEALIALYNAVLSYDESQIDITFGLYAKICINNRLISMIRSSEKNRFISEIISVEIEADNNPETNTITNESFTALLENIDKYLTQYEKSVFSLYISGKSYREIADSLGSTIKSVDNAVYRIKAKIKKLI